MEHDYVTAKYLRLIRLRARMVRVPGYEYDDFVGIFYIAIHDALPKFKSKSSEKTYVETVLSNLIIDLVRKSGAKKYTSVVKFADIGWSEVGERVWVEE